MFKSTSQQKLKLVVVDQYQRSLPTPDQWDNLLFNDINNLSTPQNQDIAFGIR